MQVLGVRSNCSKCFGFFVKKHQNKLISTVNLLLFYKLNIKQTIIVHFTVKCLNKKYQYSCQ